MRVNKSMASSTGTEEPAVVAEPSLVVPLSTEAVRTVSPSVTALTFHSSTMSMKSAKRSHNQERKFGRHTAKDATKDAADVRLHTSDITHVSVTL